MAQMIDRLHDVWDREARRWQIQGSDPVMVIERTLEEDLLPPNGSVALNESFQVFRCEGMEEARFLKRDLILKALMAEMEKLDEDLVHNLAQPLDAPKCDKCDGRGDLEDENDDWNSIECDKCEGWGRMGPSFIGCFVPPRANDLWKARGGKYAELEKDGGYISDAEGRVIYVWGVEGMKVDPFHDPSDRRFDVEPEPDKEPELAQLSSMPSSAISHNPNPDPNPPKRPGPFDAWMSACGIDPETETSASMAFLRKTFEAGRRVETG